MYFKIIKLKYMVLVKYYVNEVNENRKHFDDNFQKINLKFMFTVL